MRKIILLTLISVLALGIIFAWAEQNTVVGKKLAKNVTATFAKKVVKASKATQLMSEDQVGKTAKARPEPNGKALPGKSINQIAQVAAEQPKQAEGGMKPIDITTPADLAAKKAEEAKNNSLLNRKTLNNSNVVIDHYSKPAQPEEKQVIENGTPVIGAQPTAEQPKWKPVYGAKGEITNPQPSIDINQVTPTPVVKHIAPQLPKTGAPVPDAPKAGPASKSAVQPTQETKWEPIYGEKGEIMNPESTMPVGYGDAQWNDYPVVNTIIPSVVFTQDFQTAWVGTTPPLPAAGWAILDSGSEGTKIWWASNDWHKFYYAATGWNDTVAASMFGTYSTDTVVSTWLVTPSFNLGDPPAFCSLFVKQYYDNVSTTRDSANIMISTDNGGTWQRVQTWKADQTNPTRSRINLSAYMGYTQTKLAFWHYFGGLGSSQTSSNGWIVDSVTIVTDGGTQVFQDFGNVGYGWYANGAATWPSGWTGLDQGTVAAPAQWNNNDFYRRNTLGQTSGSPLNYAAAVTNVGTNRRGEIQNEYLISPSFVIPGGVAACSLSEAEYYNGTFSISSYPYSPPLPLDSVKARYWIYVQEDTSVAGIGNYTPMQQLFTYNGVDRGSTSSKFIFTYNMAPWVGKRVRLAWRFVVPTAYGGGTFYMDDPTVTTYSMSSHDVATTAINSPSATTLPSNLVQNINNRVSNLGANAETFDDSTDIYTYTTNQFFFENFSVPQSWNKTTPPTGWTITDSSSIPGTTVAWTAYNNTSQSPADTVARCYYLSTASNNSRLISPTIDCSVKYGVHLKFNAYYLDAGVNATDTVWILGSKDNFATTAVIAMWNESHGTTSILETDDYDISAWADGQANVKIAFKYKAVYQNYVYIDKVALYECVPVSYVYQSKETVTGLASLASTNVPYATTWTPAIGSYMMKTFTTLAGDDNTSNNVQSKAISVLQHDGTGGPDAGYYRWKDNTVVGGPVYNWVSMSSATVCTLSSYDSGVSRGFSMGGAFNFYGVNYSYIKLGANGVVTLDTTQTALADGNVAIPTAAAPNAILPFYWDDMNSAVGHLKYWNDVANNRFVIQYDSLAHYGTALKVDAQIILNRADSSITYQYNNLSAGLQNDVTIGIENGTGTVGLSYYFTTALLGGLGNFPWNGLAVKFYPSLPDDEVAAVSITSPPNTILAGWPYPATGTVKNNGVVAQTIDIYMRADTGVTFAKYWIDSLIGVNVNAGATLPVSFTNFTAANIDTFRFVMKIVNPGDVNTVNDSTAYYTVYAPSMIPTHDVGTLGIYLPGYAYNGRPWPIYTAVGNYGANTESFDDSTYFDTVIVGATIMSTGFENAGSIPTGWTDAGGHPWLYNGGTSHGPNTTHGGSYAAYYDIYNYSSGYNDSLISPSMDLSLGGGNYILSYWSWFSSGSDSVVAFLDQSGAKTRLGKMPKSSTWTQNSIAFKSTSATAKIYFVGYSLYGSYNPYIDDVAVYAYSLSHISAGFAQNVSGLAPLTGVYVPYTATWTPTSAGSFLEHSFTALTGDVVPANDDMLKGVTVYAHTGAAGPDAGYYSYMDDFTGGPAYGWKDISGIGTPVPFTIGTAGDNTTPPIPLGFSFQYYGNTFTNIFLSENGFASFDTIIASSGGYYNYSIPTATTPNNLLALFWDDLKKGTAGSAYYYTNNADTFIVSYLKFTGSTTDTVSAQIILSKNDKKIKFQYQTFGPSMTLSHTVGIENSTGLAGYGLQYIYNGAPLGNLPYAPLAITYTFDPPSLDAASNNIVTPTGLVVSGTTFTPKTRVTNGGSITETFSSFFDIYFGVSRVYHDSVLTHTLGAGLSDTVSFVPTSLVPLGAYSCTSYVVLAGDAYPSNDKTSNAFTVDMHYGTGGPDAMLYKWIDNTVVGGPAYAWDELDPDLGGDGLATQFLTTSVDDAAFKFMIAPSFSFPFYGVNYDSGWVSTNGMISFAAAQTAYSNTNIPNSATPDNFIVPFWDDMYPSAPPASKLLFEDMRDHVTLQWQNFGNSGGPKTQVFEVQLWPDGQIIFQYKNVGGYTNYLGESATIGIESRSIPPVTGLQYLLNGVPALNKVTNNLAIRYFIYTPTLDVSAFTYDAPKVAFVGTPAYPAATVKNNGISATTANVTIKIVGPAPATDTVFNYMETTPSIAPGASYPFTFSANSWNPAATGSYTILVNATCTGDELSGNNNTTGSAFVLSTASLPYSTDLEANNGGFVGTNQWQWGTPAYATGPVAAHSPVNCWGTNLTGDYSAYADNKLYSPAITLSGAPRYSLDFWMWYRFESISYDGANLKISTNNGLTWTVLATSVPYTGSCTSTGNALLYGQQGWGGVDTIWTPVHVDLTPYAGQTVIFRFDQGSESSIQYAGIYIDDFSISQVFADVAVNSIDAPAAAMLFAGSYQISATLANFGTTTEILDSVVFSVSDATPAEIFHEVATGVSLPVGTAPITSVGSWVGAPGTYHATVTAYLASDGSTANNTKTRTYTVVAVKPFPYAEPFNNTPWGSDIRIFYNGTGAGIYISTTVTHGASPDTALQFHYSPYPRDVWVVMPPVTLVGTTNPRLSFWETADSYWAADPAERHYALVGTGSFDLGNYDTLLLENPATYTIGDGVWQQNVINLSAYVNDTVWVMFEDHTQTYDCGEWFIDDVVLEETPLIDVAVNSIDAPVVNWMNDFIPGSYTITATLENFGIVSEVLDSIVFQVYDDAAVPAEVFHNVRTGDALAVGTAQFSSTAPWLAVGDCIGYTPVVTVYLSTDVNASNDSYTNPYPLYVRDVLPTPFYEPFNSTTGFNNCWLSAGSIGLSARFHTASPSIYFAGGNTAPRSSFMISPPINLAGVTHPRLTFWESANYWHRDPAEKHYLLVFNEMLNDPTHIDTIAAYDTSHFIPSGPTGTAFQQIAFDLSAYAGDTIWVWFEYFSNLNGGNWYLDDINVSETPHDVAALSIIEPVSPITAGVTFTPKTTVQNLGPLPETFNVTFDIYNGGGVVHTETITGFALGSGLTDTAEFTPYSITPAGAYACTSYVAMPTDINPANNKVGMALTVNAAGYEYAPGDANMTLGTSVWPPDGIHFTGGADVTYLVRYFKGLVNGCVFVNPSSPNSPFYAAADANGSCNLTAGDVTRIVQYLKGNPLAPLLYCTDYPPIAPTHGNYPACTSVAPLIKQIIPTHPTTTKSE